MATKVRIYRKACYSWMEEGDCFSCCRVFPYRIKLVSPSLPSFLARGGGVVWENGKDGMIVWNSCSSASFDRRSGSREWYAHNNYLGNNRVTSM